MCVPMKTCPSHIILSLLVSSMVILLQDRHHNSQTMLPIIIHHIIPLAICPVNTSKTMHQSNVRVDQHHGSTLVVTCKLQFLASPLSIEISSAFIITSNSIISTTTIACKCCKKFIFLWLRDPFTPLRQHAIFRRWRWVNWATGPGALQWAAFPPDSWFDGAAVAATFQLVGSCHSKSLFK